MGVGTHHHFLHCVSAKLCLRHVFTHTLIHRHGRVPNCNSVCEIQCDTTHIRLVRDLRGVNFEHHWESHLHGNLCGILNVGGASRTHHWYTVGSEDEPCFNLTQPIASCI